MTIRGVMTNLVKTRLRNLPDLRKGYLYITAADFGISTPDLQYRLRREGSSYQKLLLAERSRRLELLLEQPGDLYVSDVSAALGYISEKSSRTALKQWGGLGGTHRKKVRKHEHQRRIAECDD